jgi:hypothetical protein
MASDEEYDALRRELAACEARLHEVSVACAVAEQQTALLYTAEVGEAGEQYIRSVAFDGRHHLPAQFRWSDLWDALNRAARSAAPKDPL